MTLEQARKLLGGYASGTLTPGEQEALYAAALEHQELFDELAREEALRELLGNPLARTRLIRALDAPKPAWPERAQRWLTGHAVGLAAMAGILGVAAYVGSQIRPAPDRIRMIAQEPTRVEVSGDTRREFDVSTLHRSPAPGPVIPPPPPLPRTPAVQPAQVAQTLAALTPRDETAAVELKTDALPPMPKNGPESLQPLAASSFVAVESAATRAPQAAATGPPAARAVGGVQAGAGGGTAATGAAGAEAVTLRSGQTRPQSALVSAQAQSTGAPAQLRLSPFASLTTGLRYGMLIRLAPVRHAGVAPNELAVGDMVTLMFESGYPGSLKVLDTASGRVLFESSIQMTARTGEIRLQNPGTRQFRVEFTPSGRPAPEPGIITLQVK